MLCPGTQHSWEMVEQLGDGSREKEVDTQSMPSRGTLRLSHLDSLFPGYHEVSRVLY